MQYIKQKFEDRFYTYKPGEFLPIFEGGQLANRNQFIFYKIKKAFTR
jgi:hypothetical protein